MKKKPRPIKKQALDFVAALAGSPRAVVCIQPLHDSDRSRGRIRKWFYSRVGDAWPEILALQNAGYGIFMSLNETDGEGRSGRNVTGIRAAFIDCDKVRVTREEAEAVGPLLAVAGRSEIRRHYYWRASVVKSEWPGLQTRLAEMFGSDPSMKNPDRVVRLPGTLNLKGEPVRHELLFVDGNAPALSLHDFKLREPITRGAPEEITEGERNALLYKIACRGVNQGLSEGERLARLIEVNQERVHPELPLAEIIALNRSAEKHSRGGDETGRSAFGSWAWVSATGSFFHLKTLQETAPASFDRDFNHHFARGSASDRVTRERLVVKCERPVYRPDGPRLIEQPDDRSPLLNLYRPPLIEPRKGDIGPLLDHLAYLAPDEREHVHLFDWLCHNARWPGRKLHHAVLLQGKQGTGKSYIKQLMQLALGPHNVAAPGNDTLCDDFTAWIEARCMICIEELMFRGRLDVLNRMKAIITEPTIHVRRMRQLSYETNNTVNVFATTNHKTAIRLDDDDRRWFVVFSPAEPREPKYYDALFGDLERLAAAFLYHALNEHEFSSDFKPLGRAPRTRGRKAVIELGKSRLEQWVEERVEGREAPFNGDLFTLPEVMAHDGFFVEFGRLSRVDRKLTDALLSAGAEQLGRIRLASGRKTVWALRDVKRWREASAEEIRNFFSGAGEKIEERA